MAERLKRQIEFILEVDRLKQVYRQNLLVDGSRRENDAEHSWHLALMAMVLQEYSEQPVDLGHVLELVVVHDLVEVYAGDTFCYDPKGAETKAERENAAAQRLYGLLPAKQDSHFLQLWEEFEVRQTAEAKFAAGLDRLQPLLNNYHTEGGTWRIHRINSTQVLRRVDVIAEGSGALAEFAKSLIEDAVAKGILAE